ncbi:MAG: glutaminase, partial [Bacteroidales bacterium]
MQSNGKNIDEIITKIYNTYQDYIGDGELADYIPALANVNPNKYAISVCGINGECFNIGDCNTKFSIQSISKVFTLAMLVPKLGDDVWKSVGREPSGNQFNSLVQLEYEQGIPRNPFINAGALVITDKLLNYNKEPKYEIISFVRKLAGNDDINFNKEVAESEYYTGERNKALAHLMKSFNNFDNRVKDVIDVYCHQCSIAMTTKELAQSFMFLANGGVNPLSKEQIVSARSTKRINALMLTCGLYNESGDFAYRVGLPGKSGV